MFFANSNRFLHLIEKYLYQSREQNESTLFHKQVRRVPNTSTKFPKFQNGKGLEKCLGIGETNGRAKIFWKNRVEPMNFSKKKSNIMAQRVKNLLLAVNIAIVVNICRVVDYN